MTITAAIVLFAVIWWMVFFMVLPVRFQSQDEAGAIVPGTPKSAPATSAVGRKAKITTLIAAALWLAVAAIILSGVISIHDIDMRPANHGRVGG